MLNLNQTTDFWLDAETWQILHTCNWTKIVLLCPTHREGAISVAFVRPSIAYIANNSRTQRSSVLRFGRKIPHLRCNSRTNFKDRRLKVRVTSPLMLTHRMPCLPNGKAYKLQTWCTDGGRQPASATGAVTSNVKGQGRKLTWSVWAVLAKCCTCVISGRRGIPCRPNPAATLRL